MCRQYWKSQVNLRLPILDVTDHPIIFKKYFINVFYFACKSSLIAAMNRYLFLFKNNLCGSNNLYTFALLTYLNLFITPILEVCDSKKNSHENHKMVICHETEWLAASIYCCMKFFAPLAVNFNVIINQQLRVAFKYI